MVSLIAQGAEAVILGKNGNIIKDRIVKKYRIPELDFKLRKQRTKKEISLLEKAKKIIPVPKIIKSSDFRIEMELINGEKLSGALDNLKNASAVCRKIGQNIAKLHDANIIHGDLTTSNMIYVKLNNNSDKSKSVIVCDFDLFILF